MPSLSWLAASHGEFALQFHLLEAMFTLGLVPACMCWTVGRAVVTGSPSPRIGGRAIQLWAMLRSCSLRRFPYAPATYYTPACEDTQRPVTVPGAFNVHFVISWPFCMQSATPSYGPCASMHPVHCTKQKQRPTLEDCQRLSDECIDWSSGPAWTATALRAALTAALLTSFYPWRCRDADTSNHCGCMYANILIKTDMLSRFLASIQSPMLLLVALLKAGLSKFLGLHSHTSSRVLLNQALLLKQDL